MQSLTLNDAFGIGFVLGLIISVGIVALLKWVNRDTADEIIKEVHFTIIGPSPQSIEPGSTWALSPAGKLPWKRPAPPIGATIAGPRSLDKAHVPLNSTASVSIKLHSPLEAA